MKSNTNIQSAQQQHMPSTRLKKLVIEEETLLSLWKQAKTQLHAQLHQRTPSAVFLEGSIAEGFGNSRSDVDFVAIIDDGTEVATMPYILFIDDRRVEVRLLSYNRLKRELLSVRDVLANDSKQLSSDLSWNLMERCQRFMGAIPIENAVYIQQLQAILGTEGLEQAVAGWFEDFTQQTARYAIAMHSLAQPDYAKAWIKTAVFHAAKSYVAQQGEYYLGSKWLALQLERAAIDHALVDDFWTFMHISAKEIDSQTYLETGIALINRMHITGVELNSDQIVVERQPSVTSWQIGQHLHILRKQDIFRIKETAARSWRLVIFGQSCNAIIASTKDATPIDKIKQSLADFSRFGFIRLHWLGEGEIRINQTPKSVLMPLGSAPIISFDGARVKKYSEEIQLLPLPAKRFAEAGINLNWANIGVENSREDAEGALKNKQWQVLEYTSQRMIQAASMIVLAAHGVTPQPSLEEAILETTCYFPLSDSLLNKIQRIEHEHINSELEAKARLTMANDVVRQLRILADEAEFPSSFDNASGWCDTILYSYDWINLGTHLGSRFPSTAVGGRGTAEEARDLLTSV